MIVASKRKLRLTTDKRGYITTGMKTEKGFPKSLDYFDVSGFPEIQEHYGDKPSSLIIAPPVNDIPSFYNDEYATWSNKHGHIKKRQCDGETCLHRVKETVQGMEFGRGEVSPCLCEGMPEGAKDRCQYSAILKAYIATPDGMNWISPVVYGFRTGSPNSGDSIFSELQRLDFVLRQSNGGQPSLAGRPLTLSVRMVTGTEEKPTKFPIWSLSAFSFQTPQLPEGTSQVHALEAGEPDSQIIDELTELGEKVYGDKWEEMARKIAEKASEGAESDIGKLNAKERRETIEWLKEKAKEST